MEATLEATKVGAKLAAATTDVFQKGIYETGKFTVKASKDKKVKSALPVVDVFIVAPKTKGMYPVLMFCPGWKMTNEWYSDMFAHIASHGFIIVAPQLYVNFWVSMSEEIRNGVAVTEWLSTGLLAALEANSYSNVYPDVGNLVISGHSRGGKTAFALALGETGDKTKKRNRKKTTSPMMIRNPAAQKYKAVMGIDPVGGPSPADRPDPQILQYIPRCFNMSIPVGVVGAGYSNQSKGPLMPPCAANGVNHAEFFNESKPPVCYFLAKDYGHFDMMNDNVWFLDWVCRPIAKGCSGPREPMRRAVGGAVVAFLRAYVGGDEEDLDVIVNDPTVAPVVLDPVLHVTV